MENKMRVVLIDGMNLSYRAQHTHAHLATKTGSPTGVIFAFLKMLHQIYVRFELAPIVIFWEGGTIQVIKEGKTYELVEGITTWRKSLPRQSYKANRMGVTEHKIAVHRQIPEVQKVMAYLRHTQISVPGLEGDDLIGIASAKLSAMPNVDEVAIISSDKDFFQCIDTKVRVYRPGQGKLDKYNSKKVHMEFGVTPEQWAAYKAFIGDSSDHYKGVNGIGPAKAVEIINMQADPSLSWKDQPKVMRSKFPTLEDKWRDAQDCYNLAVIPKSTNYKLLSAELQQEARKAFLNFEKQLFRKFTVEELRVSIDLFVKFCSKWELESILSEKRRYFEGIICGGNIIK